MDHVKIPNLGYLVLFLLFLRLCGFSRTVEKERKSRSTLKVSVLATDGAILNSAGDLENDEKNANIIHDLVTLTESIDPKLFPKNAFQKISIIYEEHFYTICLSNKRIHIIKRKNPHDIRSTDAIIT